MAGTITDIHYEGKFEGTLCKISTYAQALHPKPLCRTPIGPLKGTLMDPFKGTLNPPPDTKKEHGGLSHRGRGLFGLRDLRFRGF